MANKCLSVVLHGGAGAKAGRNYDREIEHMRGLIEAARDALKAGASALDVAETTTRQLEASGLYVAGRGASPNTDGVYELDAAIMDGHALRCGAVAALEGFESPIAVAREVLERTQHVMLAGSGAAGLAAARGYARVTDPEAWFTRAGAFEDNHPPGKLAHGTVGCVVRDGEGRLAACTSTGGVFGKLPGRVGDTPIIGAGCWADARVAVSCTGQGEYFVKVAAAAQLAHRMRFGGQSVTEAADAVLAEIAALGGDGGLIAVTADGSIAMPYVSEGMKRAALTPDGEIVSAAFAL
ncbi:MAG TPA: isoaspartyl peptidase/L-asparaginase [Caulobacter sp.]|nr:isoaspartyl peptidase/L-asparaginase [Caulobacter sp.]